MARWWAQAALRNIRRWAITEEAEGGGAFNRMADGDPSEERWGWCDVGPASLMVNVDSKLRCTLRVPTDAPRRLEAFDERHVDAFEEKEARESIVDMREPPYLS